MIYLDNASTTKPSDGVKKAVLDAMENFGNPSSMHRLGIDAEKIVKNSRLAVSNVLGVSPDNIFFTSGGTEANNTAILGYCRRNKKRGTHIITSAIEHPSVAVPFKKLSEEGFDVTVIGVDKEGKLDLDAFKKALREDTIFVSVMWVNNETGNIQPVDKLKALMKSLAPKAVLHVDAVQAFGKIECKPNKFGIDMLSVSGHKIHGIKGIGALYINNGINFDPHIIGGGQQKDKRSGTENVVGIAAIGEATRELTFQNDKIYTLRDRLMSGLLENVPNIRINGEGEKSPFILNVSFIGIKAEILLHTLENHGIFVSTGSACSTNKPMPSPVLTAMGLKREEIMGAVRFSLSEDICEEDIDKTILAVTKEVENIRRIMR